MVIPSVPNEGPGLEVLPHLTLFFTMFFSGIMGNLPSTTFELQEIYLYLDIQL